MGGSPLRQTFEKVQVKPVLHVLGAKPFIPSELSSQIFHLVAEAGHFLKTQVGGTAHLLLKRRSAAPLGVG